jgi:tetratricopeptide (TPR) repeat protein
LYEKKGVAGKIRTAYVSGRGDPMGMFFMLLTVYFSFSTFLRGKIAAVIFFICALLSKELTIITPLIIFLCHMADKKTITKKYISESLKIAGPFIGINIGYIFLRLTILNFANTLNFYNSHNIYSDSLIVRLITFLALLPQYVGLIFYPKLLFIDRSADIVANPNLLTVTVLLFICGIAAGSFYWYKRSVIPLFSFLFFFTAFIPTSGIIPINGVFFEHFFYYPSVGFFLFFSYVFYFLLTHIPKIFQVVLIVTIILFMGALSIRTMYRNAEWRDPITFYSQTIKYTQSARIYNNLAMSYADAGEQSKAVIMYKEAIMLGDFYPQTHYNLANTHADLGDLVSAEKEYRKALKIDPYFYLAYFKLFSIYKSENSTEKQQEIINHVREIVQKNPAFQPILTQLEQAQ